MLVHLTSDPDLAADARDDGFDIAFTAGATKLSHQIESFNGATGELLAWVRVPALSSSSDTVVQMYYGNPGSPDQQDAANTWNAGYAGVWHLGEDPLGPGPQFEDSSNNPNDGTALPIGFEPSQVGGQIGGGLLFDGSNDRKVEVAHHGSLALGADMTVEAWVRTANTDGSADVILAKWLTGGNRNYWLGKFDGLTLAFYVDDLQYVDAPLNLITNDAWHHVAGVAKQSTGRLYIYVDGVERNSATYDGASQTGTSVLQIGLSADNSNEEWDGRIDEARVSGMARSGGWIRTEYNNQASPSDFYSVGPEVSNSAFCAATPTSTVTHTPTPTSTPTATATPVGLLLVNSSGDGADANTGDGICQTSTPGECTLRAAIAQANASAGLNTIQFNLPGPGPYTLQPASVYPDITDAVIIDGTTQPGFAGTPIVEIDGTNAGGSPICLRITGPNSTVRGLVINRCSGAGMEIMGSGASGNVVAGNYLGTDLTGTVALPNYYGIYLTSGAHDNTIGGTTAADRNVISGNNAYGVLISWTGTDANVVQGNYIGTNAAGTSALPNADTGVRFQGGPLNNMVGGTMPGARNVISGNGTVGVYTAGGNAVQGNFIGTDATGTHGIPNAKFGVQTDGVGSTVGGTAAGAGNVIAYNTEDGLVVTFNGAKGNSFLGNSIYANGHLGIDLKDDGVTSNDNLDKDNGPNDLQNFPVLTQARTNGAGMVIIDGTLNSVANTTFRLEFFASTSGDPSGYGEGERYLGFVDVTTDGAGDVVFSQTFMASVDAGEVITATAIDPAGNSSEFSAWIAATPL